MVRYPFTFRIPGSSKGKWVMNRPLFQSSRTLLVVAVMVMLLLLPWHWVIQVSGVLVSINLIHECRRIMHVSGVLA